jgi:FKBP-type peptidyl-prolyl cis-trans isomerase FkpA
MRTFQFLLAMSLLAVIASCTSLPQNKPAVEADKTATASPSAASTPSGEGLKIIDRKVGDGKEAAVGKAAMVHYTGWLYDDKAPDNKGKQFDSSAKREGLPFGFVVGVGRVIKGWDQGVVGMKVGGSRTLIIPAALAYGDKDVGNGLIPANSTLVFDIELVEVKP